MSDGEKPSTRFEGYAPLSIVEAHHSDNKAWRAAHIQEHGDLSKRVLFLEFRDAELEKRLNEGSKSFTQFEGKLKEFSDKIHWPIWKIAASFVGVLTVAGSIIWAAARYPNREEFQSLQGEVSALKTQAAVQQKALETVSNDVRQSKEEIIGKIETLITKTKSSP